MFNWLKKKKASTEHLPDYWKTYLDHFQQTYSKNDPIEKVRFVCFDTETTGLDTSTDQILSIGAVGIRNWKIEVADRFECLVHQEYHPSGKSIEVHGILPVEREESRPEGKAIPAFLSYIRDAVLVGHHLSFDVNMVQQSLLEQTGEKLKLKNHQLDTIAMARRLLPAHHYLTAGELGLDQLAEKYRISLSDRHTAGGDAFITAFLFLKLLDRLQRRGVKTLGALLKK